MTRLHRRSLAAGRSSVIDWLKLRLLINAAGKVPGDKVMIITPDGEVKWEKIRPKEVVGSYDANIHVSACPVKGMLVIDGNPAKFFQGHNVFGTDDIHGLAKAISFHVLGLLPELVVTDHDLSNIRGGIIEVARADLTGMYSLGTQMHATSAVRALGERATLRHRGRGNISRDGTAYWGKHSRRSALKVYAKGVELRDHPMHRDLPHYDNIYAWAQDKLRVELVLRGIELKQRGLDLLANWQQDTAALLYAEFLGKLNVPDNIELDPLAVESLKPRLRLAYDSWMRGTDLRTALPRKTYYRYRKDLLEHGIDILTVRPAPSKSNVLPLVRILEAKPASVPEWAIGTSAFFDPRRVA
jgi:II/X family phage/plasmid replication protein